MPKKPEHALAEELASIKRRLKAVEAKPKLARSSIDDGRLVTKDRDGRVREIIGRQPDGSHGSRVVASPPQPTPSAPSLSAGEAAVVSVKWDGQADGAVPLVHGRVDVLAAFVPEGEEPVFSQAEVVSSIRDRDGGGTAFAADQAGTWAVWLVMVGQDRVTRSEPSEVSTLVVSMPVDGAAIEAELDQARQDLADAEAEWEQSKTDLQAGLDQINNETIPQVRTDAQQWADDAEAAAVAQAAQDAQAEYDRLQELAERALRRTNNLIHDGSFETDWYQQAWSSDDLQVRTVEHGSVDATDGVQIVRVDTTGGMIHGSLNFTPESYAGEVPTNNFRELDIPVEPGQVWRFSMDARATNSTFDGTMRIRCNIAGTVTTVEQLEFTPTLEWQTYTLDVTIPDGVTGIYWMWRPSVAEGGFFADRVSARDITEIKAALDAAEEAKQAAQDAHAAAGDAWDHADTAMTRAGQVGSRMGGETTPTGTAPENSIWFQWSDMDDPNRTVLGVWQMIDGNWVEQDSSDPALIPTVDIGAATVGTLKAVRIDVASLFVDTQFVNNLHAEAVEAMKVTAETGFIGGTLLEDGAVNTDKLLAQAVTAGKIDALAVNATHLAANAVTAAKIDAGAVNAAKIDFQDMVGSSAFIDEIGAVELSIMGRFQTVYANGAGLEIDQGDVSYYSLRTGSVRTATNTPYIRLSDGSGTTAEQPIIAADGTDLIIASGRDSGGDVRPINLDGRVLANSAVISAEARASNFYARDYPFNMDLNAVQLNFWSDDNSRRFGVGQSGYRLKIWGQLPAGHGQDDMVVSGGMSSYESLDSGVAKWGTFTYGTAPRVGRRTPFATARLSTGSRDAFRTVIVDTAAAGTSGFNWVARAPTDNSGSASFQIDYVAFWDRD